MTEFVLTTHPGLEAIVAEELATRVGSVGPRVLEPTTEPGRVLVQLPDGLRPILMSLRSVHHVIEGIARWSLPEPVTLEGIQAAVRQVEVPGLTEAKTFRVTSVRRGRHTFGHMDIERAAGAVYHLATGVPVNLNAPAVTIRVDLDGNVLWVGRALTDRPLSRRAKVYAQRVGLSADLAYAAVHVAALTAPERILDPFCGSGTLLVEAGFAHPDAELWGGDWVESAADGTRRNLDAAGLGDRAHVVEQDALRMAERYPAQSFDAIVTNPPFGVKMGPRIDFFRFYARLLAQAEAVLKPDGRLVVWVHRLGQLNAAVKTHGRFERYRTVTVQTGTARPTVVALRRSHD